MGFTFVAGQDDHALEDAVRRGVAEGLARMLGVPSHPEGVQALLDNAARAEDDLVDTQVLVAALPVRIVR